MFEKIACAAAEYAGTPYAIGFSAVIIALTFWVLGLDAANILISIVSLLLLFLLQGSTNRDGAAIQAKLDELIRSSSARDEFMGLDRRQKEEIESKRDA
jgi:low affinity Fe/Cu permease